MDYTKTKYSENTFYKSENWKYYIQFKNIDNSRIIYQFELEKIDENKINIKMDSYNLNMDLFRKWIKKIDHDQKEKTFNIKKLEYNFTWSRIWTDYYARLSWKKTFYFLDSLETLLEKFKNWNDLLNPLMDKYFLRNSIEK